MSHTRSVHLRWTAEGQAFEGRGAADRWITIDGDSTEGPSPTESLLLSLAACMAIDVRMILEKGRVPLRSLEVELEGDRREDVPRYFHRMRMAFKLAGPGPEHGAKIERAIDLSRDKYCSVLHTLRPDLDLRISFERV